MPVVTLVCFTQHYHVLNIGDDVLDWTDDVYWCVCYELAAQRRAHGHSFLPDYQHLLCELWTEDFEYLSSQETGDELNLI